MQNHVMSPVLITSAVKPASNADTGLTLESDRHSQCRDAVIFLLEKRQFGHYVICDGSDVEIFTPAEIVTLSKKYSVEIEQLKFQQDRERVRLQGKSYGELEIVFYALKHAELIKRYGSFTKISGRYSITNLPQIMAKLGRLNNFFYFDNPVRFNFGKRYVCTIIYRSEVDFFLENFRDSMIESSYAKEGILESIFYRRLAGLKKTSLRVPFPYYTGISGVTGKTIVNSRYFIRSILSRLGILCHTF